VGDGVGVDHQQLVGGDGPEEVAQLVVWGVGRGCGGWWGAVGGGACGLGEQGVARLTHIGQSAA